MNIGIIGAGNIAGKMAATLRGMDDMRLYAVAARDLARARAFAEKEGAEKAYGSYEELVRDPQVELVYIATPHSHHYAHMKLCIAHRKPILCEKAFTMNTAQAQEIFELAKKEHVFIAEAIWTRYMPSRRIINELLEAGTIGRVHMGLCNLSYDIDHKERIIRPELAGGALLDIGIYGLNFLLMHMGKDFTEVRSTVAKAATGIDAQESISFLYEDGRMGTTSHSIYGLSDRKGTIYGDNGYLVVDNINDPLRVDVYDASGDLTQTIPMPEQITGYEYEVRECADCISRGVLEPDSMPWEETLYVMELMDSLRREWGIAYPEE